MSSSIGNKTIVFSDSFLVPENEILHIRFIYDGEDDIQNFEVTFEEREQEQKSEKISSQLEFQGDKNKLCLSFINWNSPLGVATTTPIGVGTSGNGQEISILASVKKIGSIYQLHIQVLLQTQEAK